MLFIAAVINLIRSPPALLSSGMTGHLHQLTPAQNTISKCMRFVLKPGASAVRGQRVKHPQVCFELLLGLNRERMKTTLN